MSKISSKENRESTDAADQKSGILGTDSFIISRYEFLGNFFSLCDDSSETEDIVGTVVNCPLS